MTNENDAGPTREIQVIAMLADGLSYKEIAIMLQIRPATVRSYAYWFMRRHCMKTITGAVAKAIRERIIE